MNRRVIGIWAIVLVTLFWVCAKTQLLASLFTLLVLGMVPGTDLAMPAWLMLLLYPIGFFVAIYWLSTRTIYIGAPEEKPIAKTIKNVARKKKSSNTKKTTVAKRRSRAVA